MDHAVKEAARLGLESALQNCIIHRDNQGMAPLGYTVDEYTTTGLDGKFYNQYW